METPSQPPPKRGRGYREGGGNIRKGGGINRDPCRTWDRLYLRAYTFEHYLLIPLFLIYIALK